MYQRQQPEPLPFQRNLKVRLPQGHLLISTTRLMVTVHHFPSPRAEPDYTIRFLVEDNPEMAHILHPVDGWDLLGLINFLWRKLDILRTLDLRDEAIRSEYGLRTVSTPFQTRTRQEKRPMEQALQMICDFVLENPNCTRLEISRHLGRAKNPYVLTQIEWLVSNGKLARSINPRPNGTFEYRYIFVGN